MQEQKTRPEPRPLNGVDTPNLFGTINVVKGQPELAKFQFRANRLQRLQMQIDRPRPDRTAAGQGNHRLPMARQKRPEHQDRGPHLANDVVVGLVARRLVRRQRKHAPILQRLHLGAQRLKQ